MTVFNLFFITLFVEVSLLSIAFTAYSFYLFLNGEIKTMKIMLNINKDMGERNQQLEAGIYRAMSMIPNTIGYSLEEQARDILWETLNKHAQSNLMKYLKVKV